MNTRHSQRWLVWLLPLFALRAFIPAGFMLSWSDTGLQLVMCSGSGPMVTAEHGRHGSVQTGAAQTHDKQHEHSRADSATMCPFAAASTAGALPCFDAGVAFFAAISHAVRQPLSLELPSDPVLIDRIRGPPLA